MVGFRKSSHIYKLTYDKEKTTEIWRCLSEKQVHVLPSKAGPTRTKQL